MSRIACLLFLLLPSHLFAQRPSLSALLDGEAVELSRLGARMSWRNARPGVDWTEVQLRAGF